MKKIKYFLILSLAFFGACNGGIDPISKVEQGADELAPTLTISFPLEGTKVRAEEPMTSVGIAFEAIDDIELASVSVKLDGTELVNFTDFKDYRQFTEEYLYDKLTDGDHVLTIDATDLTGKSITKTVNFQKTTPYNAIYPGEVFYMPFDGDYFEQIMNKPATKVGSPGFAEGKVGKAFAGAPNSYLTFPTDSLVKTQAISAVFWMKINATPPRAGILTVSAVDNAPTVPGTQNHRGSGFRFFRELDGTLERFKLNVGVGAKLETWNDGGTVDPVLAEWVHFAFTVSGTTTKVYVDGVKATKPDGVMTVPIDWTGCDLLTIMSGAPRFTEWEHFSDLSLLDELRIFNKELTVEEVNTIMNAEN